MLDKQAATHVLKRRHAIRGGYRNIVTIPVCEAEQDITNYIKLAARKHPDYLADFSAKVFECKLQVQGCLDAIIDIFFPSCIFFKR